MKIVINAIDAPDDIWFVDILKKDHQVTVVHQKTNMDLFVKLPTTVQYLAAHNFACYSTSMFVQQHLLNGENTDIVITVTGTPKPGRLPCIDIEPDMVAIDEYKKYHILIADYRNTVSDAATFFRTSLWWKMAYNELDIEKELQARRPWIDEHFDETTYDLYFWGSWILMNRLKWKEL